MHDIDKTKEQLVAELEAARTRITSLEARATKHRRMEEALRPLTDELTTLFDNVPASIWYKDTNNAFIRVNKSAASLCGMEADAINGRSAYELFPEEAEKYYADDLEVLRSGKPKLGIVEKITAKDGAVRWLNTDKLPVRDANGVITGLLAFAVDITERKNAEEELLGSRQHLADILSWKESIINSSAVGILVVTKNRVITEVNKGFVEMFGYSPEELIGSPVSMIHVDEGQSLEFGKRYWATTSKRKVVKAQWQMRRKNGELFWCELTGSAINSRNIQKGVVWVLNDISERKRMQEMMIQSEKMMTVGGLAAGMAHEINNPLGGILQSLQNIKRRLSPKLSANADLAHALGCSLETILGYLRERQIVEFLDAIEESGKRASRIVSNMLDFSRKDSSARTDADVNGLIEKSITLCAANYDPTNGSDFKKIRIERDFDPNLPRVPCVPSQIEQVMVNLLQNAMQALDNRPETEPPGRIVVRTRANADGVCIEVEDNGPGMDPEVRKRAFDPFYTTKPVGKGTGLGLSVSYFIVTNNHGGTIEAESSFGRGARFIICLPASQASAPMTGRQAVPAL